MNSPKRLEKLILLVEDNSDIREIFAMCLQDAGYEVLQAGDGTEALPLIRRLMPRAVITDLQMPNMDGLELARIMKNTSSLTQIPLGLITATPLQHGLTEVHWFARVLAKPCSIENLLNMADFLSA